MAPSRRRVQFEMPSFRTVSAKLAAVFVVGSVVARLIEDSTGFSLRLVPGQVMTDFTLWQLVTFIPVEFSAMGIVFGAIVIWSMGGYLEGWWGPKRMFVVLAVVMVATGLLTVAGAALYGPMRSFAFTGGWAMAGAIWVLYGLTIGRGETNFWGIPLTGNSLAAIGVGFVGLQAVAGRPEGVPLRWGIISVVPDLLALAMCYGYMRWGSPRKLWTKVQSFWLERQVRRRSRRLSVISGQRNMPSDSDRFLH
jgi:membrane associated rhomboid family serine protease